MQKIAKCNLLLIFFSYMLRQSEFSPPGTTVSYDETKGSPVFTISSSLILTNVSMASKAQGKVRQASGTFSVCSCHRRMINSEEKSKVVAAAWETEFIQFLASLAILHQDDLKKRMSSGVDALKKWMIIRFTPPSFQNGCSLKN